MSLMTPQTQLFLSIVPGMIERPKHMNPVLLKTGIPLVLSLAGWFFFSSPVKRKITRNRVPTETKMPQNLTNNTPRLLVVHQESCSESLASASLACDEEEEGGDLLTHTQSSDSSEMHQFKQIDYRPEFEQEITSLKNRVSALQIREGELEEHFIRYCRSQEHESALRDLRNAFEFEIAHVDFLALKLEIMGAENQRLESVLAEYPRVIEELGSARLQVKSLQKKTKKLLRMKREGLSAFHRQTLALRKREAEISSRDEELKQRNRDIEELEAAVAELRRRADQLQMEKYELMERLELVENSQSSTPKTIAKDSNQQGLDCEELLAQVEQLQNERATDVDELIYLRWINACLRYELMRIQEERHKVNCESFLESTELHDVENFEMPYGLDNQEQGCEDDEEGKQPRPKFSGNSNELKKHEIVCSSNNVAIETEHREASMDAETTRPSAQRKPMLLGKLKRWAKGQEKRKRSCDEKENQDNCSGRCSVSDMAIEDFTARKSCSPSTPCFWVENVSS